MKRESVFTALSSGGKDRAKKLIGDGRPGLGEIQSTCSGWVRIRSCRVLVRVLVNLVNGAHFFWDAGRQELRAQRCHPGIQEGLLTDPWLPSLWYSILVALLATIRELIKI